MCSVIENRMPIFNVTLITFKQTISPVLKMRTYSKEHQYDVSKKKKKVQKIKRTPDPSYYKNKDFFLKGN